MNSNARHFLSALWTAGGAGGCLMVPGAAPFLLPLAIALPILWYPAPGLMRYLWGRSSLARLLAAGCVFLLINTQWSKSPQLAYLAVAVFFLVSLVVHVVSRTLPFVAFKPLRAMSIGFYGVYIVCALLLLSEIMFSHPVHLWVFQKLPGIAPSVVGVVVENGIVRSLPSFFLNRHMAALTFLFWPAALVALHLTKLTRVRLLLIAGLLPVLAAVAASDHESSKMALAGSLLVFGASMMVPRLTKPCLVAAWLTACVGIAPITTLMYLQQWHKAPWLQSTAQQRVIIWHETSAKIAEAPILGHGIASSRPFYIQDKERSKLADGTPWLMTIGPHAHNVYLQMWFDTGAVGVAFLLAIGLFALVAISGTGPTAQPALYAAFAAGALMAASSYSIWTPWFLASYGFATVFAIMAGAFARTEESCPPSCNKASKR